MNNLVGTSGNLPELRERVRRFVDADCIPRDRNEHAHDVCALDEAIAVLRPVARSMGVYAPQLPAAYGGLDLSWRDRAVVFEEAGRSYLAPGAMNCAPPDQPNMINLMRDGTEDQRRRYLVPLAAGEIRSCFAMTEPSPGAGADPSMMQTTAVKDGDHYVINGTKWFITGAEGATYVIIMAKMEDGSATMFLSDMDRKGISVTRQMDAMDSCFTGGHCVMTFDNVRVPAIDVLGEIGRGFKYAQVRLAPARLTHCMRWLGQARRAHDIATAYARKREAFGRILGKHEGVGFMLADNDMDLQTSRLHIAHTAWILDQGHGANFESSRAKVVCSEAEWRVVDRCVQILGGQGVTGETMVMRIFTDMRAFRIYDGPSEVHRWSMARKIIEAGEKRA